MMEDCSPLSCEEIRFIHDQMPVTLPEEDIEKWISPDGRPDEIIKDTLTEMRFEKAGSSSGTS